MNSVLRLRLTGLAIAFAVFGVDFSIKRYVMGVLRLRDVGAIEILPFFDLRWAENYGVSLGMFTAQSSEGRWLLVAMTTGIALFVLAWMLRERKAGEIAALALVLGGAMGNIRDRMMQGFVIDYADLHFGEFRPFLIFNLADAAITIGVLIILARSLFSREKPDTAAETAPES
jgi:signal peptidase II